VESLGANDIKKVIDLLIQTHGIDFGNYAVSSFNRRINRFLEINKIRDFNYFLSSLKEDISFGDRLIKEITVNVTEMFRDPSFWIVLRNEILPQLRKSSVINIWHAACSTGEEVYSMAILLQEAGLLGQTKIVATDLNGDVLKIAQEGIYPLRNQQTNNKNYELSRGKGKLSDYYTESGNTVCYDRNLVRNVDFMSHNLSQDGPFSTFNLVICRNVLIYFNSGLQEKVIQTIEKSMAINSFLGIGSKESISWCRASRLFKQENAEENIYRKVVEKEEYQYPVLKKTIVY
jgi:chemotaxis protein methyltransferase CheR